VSKEYDEKSPRSLEKSMENLMNARLDPGQAQRGNDLLPGKVILTPKDLRSCARPESACVDENAFRFRALAMKLQPAGSLCGLHEGAAAETRNTGDLGAPDGLLSDRRVAQLDGNGRIVRTRQTDGPRVAHAPTSLG